MRRVYVYPFHERMWHWVQALIMVVLMVTGVALHLPGRVPFLGFRLATELHEWLGVLLSVNATLGLLYQVFSARLSHYLPQFHSFLGLAGEQVRYYLWGIFHGAPHPVQKTPEQKLNPLQQVTYLAILNLLLPLQLGTGLILWGARHFPQWGGALRQLPLLGPLHLLGAFLFTAFLFMHIYLATTGHTVLSNFKAMITGYEDLHPHSPAEEEA